MTLSGRWRRAALTIHVAASVGWLGAVAVFLALALSGLTSDDQQVVRAVYIAMEISGWFVIVPLAGAALLSGIIQSLGTEWGLFRHYWVLIKLLLTVFATLLLVVHMQPVSRMANVAVETTIGGADHRGIRVQLAADAGAALVVSLVTTTLSVVKPRGRTPYGQRKAREQRAAAE